MVKTLIKSGGELDAFVRNYRENGYKLFVPKVKDLPLICVAYPEYKERYCALEFIYKEDFDS